MTWSIGELEIARGAVTSIDEGALESGVYEVTVSVQSAATTATTTIVLDISPDGDGREIDDCPALFDPGGRDIDNDGLGDACDSDDDDDGVPDSRDPCPSTANGRLVDVDLDGNPNRCDADPLDAKPVTRLPWTWQGNWNKTPSRGSSIPTLPKTACWPAPILTP